MDFIPNPGIQMKEFIINTCIIMALINAAFLLVNFNMYSVVGLMFSLIGAYTLTWL